MNLPTWMPSTDSLFDPSSTPISIYKYLKRWMKLNLSSDENLLMELGGSESWPQRGVTRDIEIRQALQYVITELGQHAGFNTRRLCLTILPKVYPDRYERSGIQTAYAAAAITLLILRCLNYRTNNDLTDQLAMPNMPITPFQPSDDISSRHRIKDAPPSSFEYSASKICTKSPRIRSQEYKRTHMVQNPSGLLRTYHER